VEPADRTGGTHEDRREERADVDTHVEDREARVASTVLTGVQLTDHRGDVGLEQPGPEGDQNDPEVGELRIRHRQADVAGGDDDTAVERRSPCTEDPVREPSADDGEQVDRRSVDRHDGQTGGLADTETAGGDSIRQVVEQDGAHPVVAEPFPQLRGEKRHQTERVAEEPAVARDCASDRLGLSRVLIHLNYGAP